MIAQKVFDVDPSFALDMIKRGRAHDLSKLDTFEFTHLWKKSLKFEEALKHHHELNSHHPEHHPGGYLGMTNGDIAEMVCDCLARSQEFGTDIREWLFRTAAVKYGYQEDARFLYKLDYYLKILLTPTFDQELEQRAKEMYAKGERMSDEIVLPKGSLLDSLRKLKNGQ